MAEAYGRLGNRLRRILVLLPYVIENPGVTVGELAERFGAKRREVVEDLNMVALCGLPGYSPLELIEVFIGEDDTVSVSMADYFAAPLRLSPVEALTLYLGGAALMSLPGLEDADALRRALQKLGRTLGGEVGLEGLQVDLERAPGEHLETLRNALEGGRRVRLEYFSAARGTLSERDVDPWSLIAALGRWYLVGFDHRSGEERMFRTDRMKSVTLLEEEAEVPGDFEPERYRGGFSGAGGTTLSMEVSPRAIGWFAEYYPLEHREELPDGWHLVRLRSGGDHWAATLILRLGADARAVEPASAGDAARALARGIAAHHA